MCQYCQPLIKAIDGYLQKASDNLAAGLKDAGFEEPKKTVKYIESIEDAVAEALLAETDYILAEAEKSTSLFDFAARWQNIKDGDVLDTAIADIFSGNLAEFIPAYVKRYMAETDPELAYGKVKKDSTADRISNRTTAWIQSWSEDLGSMMKLNSSNEIEDILTTGLQNGEGVAWFTQQIMDSGIRDEYYKARRVAVTEVLRAHSVAQQEAFMQDPSVAGKMWKHSGSYRNAPRENHVDMDGQKVAKDEPYTLYGADGEIYYPMYPRDSSLPPGESINCHCISQPLADEDILGMSLEEREQLRQEAIDSMDDEWEKELDAENRVRAGVDEPDDSKMADLAPVDWSQAQAQSHTKEEQQAMVEYAMNAGFVVTNISVFDGDVAMFKEQVDVMADKVQSYGYKKKVSISFSNNMPDDDYARTDNNTIVYNTKALRSREITNKNLNADTYLSSTDAKGISVHEAGHLYARTYGEKGIEFAKKAYYNLYGTEISDREIVTYLRDNVSTYSVAIAADKFERPFKARYYKEIIPEVTAKNETNPNSFTEEFVRLMMEVVK